MPLVIVLDNRNQHKGEVLRDWWERAGDIHLEYLLPCAPELNSVEGV